MENIQFLGKEWKLQSHIKNGQYTTITEYVYDNFTLIVRHFFDPVFGEWWSCVLGDYPGESINIVIENETTAAKAITALEKKVEMLRTLFN
jgi:hypothetical protein